MLQVFYLDVAYIAMAMLQVYWDVAYLAMAIHICCKSFFKMFHLFQRYVASVLSGCCICRNAYVASVCPKIFICF
jgi:hypothetical protein